MGKVFARRAQQACNVAVLGFLGLGLAGCGNDGSSRTAGRGRAARAGDHPTYGAFFLRCAGYEEGHCINWYSAEGPTPDDEQVYLSSGCAPDVATLRTPCATERVYGTCTGGLSDPLAEDDPYTAYDDRVCGDVGGMLAPVQRPVHVYSEGRRSLEERRESCIQSGGTWSDQYDPAHPSGEPTFEPVDCSGPVPPRNRPEQECEGEWSRLPTRCRFEVRDSETGDVLNSGDCDGSVSAEFRPPQARWIISMGVQGNPGGSVNFEPSAEQGGPTRWAFSGAGFEMHRVLSHALQYRIGAELSPMKDDEDYICRMGWNSYYGFPYPEVADDREVDVEATKLLCRRGLGHEAIEYYLVRAAIRGHCTGSSFRPSYPGFDLFLEVESTQP